MEIERAIRRALTDEIGHDRYDVWFGERTEFRVAGRTLRVVAPSQFHQDRIRKDFAEILQNLANRMLGSASRLEYEVLTPRQVEASHPPVTASSSPGDGSDDSSANTNRHRKGRGGVSRAALHTQRLESFVVSESTQLAATSAKIILERPGACSPLFLYGPSGCGKTHLLEAIRGAAMQRMRRVVMLSSEQFTSEFLGALHGSGLPSFRRRYRDVEVLLLDDVQFFANKRATLVELQHTLDSLLRQQRQIVLSSDRSPAELNGLGFELVTRMSGGLVCGMEHPDQTARERILQAIFDDLGVDTSKEVVAFVASQISGDARQLRGAAHRLLASSEALRRPVTRELAESALADVIRATCRSVRLKDIEAAVCDVFGLEPEDLQSERRTRSVSQPRMLAMWLARKHTRAAFSEIGHFFGGRSHSTVISASKKVTKWVSGGEAIEVAHGKCPIDDAIRRVETRLRA